MSWNFSWNLFRLAWSAFIELHKPPDTTRATTLIGLAMIVIMLLHDKCLLPRTLFNQTGKLRMLKTEIRAPNEAVAR